MDKNTTAHYNSDDRSRSFMIKYNGQLTMIDLYGASKTSFDNNMADFDKAILAQTVETGMVAEDKDIIKIIMAKTVITLYASRACVQAHQKGLNQLEIALSQPYSYIARAADKLALARAEDMKQLMSDNKGELDVIKDEDIVAMEEVIAKFREVLTLPKTKIEEKKSLGTDQFLPVIHKLEIDKDMIGRLIKSYLPDLFNEWVNASKIGDITKRHTSIIVKFVDSVTNTTLRGIKATFTNGDTTIEKKSTIRGYVRVLSMEPGNWNMTAEDKRYNTASLTNIGIDDEHIERREVKLEKKGN